MKTWIEWLVRRRNPSFGFAPQVSSSLIMEFMINQMVRMFRGWRVLLLLRKPKGLLLGRGVRFFHLQRIQWGRFVKLDDQVYISGLGKEGVSLGDNVGIGAFSRLVVSTTFSDIGSHIRIGNSVGIGEYAYLGGAGGLSIGDETIVGQYFSCHPENHVTDDLSIAIRKQGVTRKGIKIGSNCWIGSKVTVLDGVTIGNGCVVAAGAVVTKSFPDNAVIGGVPARLIKMRNN